jgi:hypothetical protein
MAELTKEELKAKLDKAESNLKLAEEHLQKTAALNLTLTTENSDAATANQLLKAELETVKAESAAKDGVIAALEAELATSQSQAVGAPKTASLGGKKYRVTIPAIRHKGLIITADSILNDEDLLAELVAKGSGAVEEVTDEE